MLRMSPSLHRPMTIKLTTPRQAPCYATIIENACGSPDDWACGCTSGKVTNVNTACEAAVYECTIPEGQGKGYQPLDFSPASLTALYPPLPPFPQSQNSSDLFIHVLSSNRDGIPCRPDLRT